MYDETQKLFTMKGLSEKVNSSYLGWWWALWLISTFLGQIIFRLAFKSGSDINSLLTYTAMQIVSSVLLIPLALITVKVIKEYSRIEPLLAQISTEEPKIENNAE
jgi:uncharacterized membrane protein YhaH (DUF805 family)